MTNKRVVVTPAATTRHFPKKGERFVNGVWVFPETERRATTASDRRDQLRKLAGWPALGV